MTFHPKCGAVIVIVTRVGGAAVLSASGAICAEILETVLIQPEQTRTTPANIHSILAALEPGKDLWEVSRFTPSL